MGSNRIVSVINFRVGITGVGPSTIPIAARPTPTVFKNKLHVIIDAFVSNLHRDTIKLSKQEYRKDRNENINIRYLFI